MRAHSLNRTRSIFKSSKTNSIGEGKCNIPWTAPEPIRDMIDGMLSNGQSRNSKLTEMFLDFLKRNNPAEHLRALSILQLHQVMKGSACLLALLAIFTVAVLEKKTEVRRTCSRVRNMRTVRRGNTEYEIEVAA